MSYNRRLVELPDENYSTIHVTAEYNICANVHAYYTYYVLLFIVRDVCNKAPQLVCIYISASDNDNLISRITIILLYIRRIMVRHRP